MFIIELFGLPSVGKTTNSYLIGEKLKQNGSILYTQIDYISFIKKSHFFTKLTVVFQNVWTFLRCISLLKWNGFTLISSYFYSIKLTFKILVKAQYLSIMANCFRKNHPNQRQTLILDQNLLQHIWSISMKNGITDLEKFIDLVHSRLNAKVNILYLVRSVEDCTDSLILRSHGDSYLDNKPRAFVYNELLKGETCCNKIYKHASRKSKIFGDIVTDIDQLILKTNIISNTKLND